MSPEDLDAVVHNETRSYAFPWTRGIFSDCLAAGYECWVAVDDTASATGREDVLGHGILSMAIDEAHLLNVCIRRDRQGCGYGRAMVEHMIALARRQAANRVFLEVRLSNYIALALYNTLGFQEVAIRKDYYPSHLGKEDARVLALDLAGIER